MRIFNPEPTSLRSAMKVITTLKPSATASPTLTGAWAKYAIDLSLKAQGYYPVSMNSLYANGTIYLPKGDYPGNVDVLLRQASNTENWTRLGHQFALFRDTNSQGFSGLYLRRDGKELELVVVYLWGGARPLWAEFVESEYRMFWTIAKSIRRDLASYKLNDQLATQLKAIVDLGIESLPTVPATAKWMPVVGSLLKMLVDMYEVTKGPVATMIDIGMAGIDEDLRRKYNGTHFSEFAGTFVPNSAQGDAFGWDPRTKEIYGKWQISNSLNAEDLESSMKHILRGKTR